MQCAIAAADGCARSNALQRLVLAHPPADRMFGRFVIAELKECAGKPGSKADRGDQGRSVPWLTCWSRFGGSAPDTTPARPGKARLPSRCRKMVGGYGRVAIVILGPPCQITLFAKGVCVDDGEGMRRVAG